MHRIPTRYCGARVAVKENFPLDELAFICRHPDKVNNCMPWQQIRRVGNNSKDPQ
jgi:hypothetical protein